MPFTRGRATQTVVRQGREWADGGLGSGLSLSSLQSGLSCQEFASRLAGGCDKEEKVAGL